MDKLVNPIGQKFFLLNPHNLSEKIKLEVLISQINRNCLYNIKLYNKIGNKNYPLNEVDQCSIS